MGYQHVYNGYYVGSRQEIQNGESKIKHIFSDKPIPDNQARCLVIEQPKGKEPLAFLQEVHEQYNISLMYQAPSVVCIRLEPYLMVEDYDHGIGKMRTLSCVGNDREFGALLPVASLDTEHSSRNDNTEPFLEEFVKLGREIGVEEREVLLSGRFSAQFERHMDGLAKVSDNAFSMLRGVFDNLQWNGPDGISMAYVNHEADTGKRFDEGYVEEWADYLLPYTVSTEDCPHTLHQNTLIYVSSHDFTAGTAGNCADLYRRKDDAPERHVFAWLREDQKAFWDKVQTDEPSRTELSEAKDGARTEDVSRSTDHKSTPSQPNDVEQAIARAKEAVRREKRNKTDQGIGEREKKLPHRKTEPER